MDFTPELRFRAQCQAENTIVAAFYRILGDPAAQGRSHAALWGRGHKGSGDHDDQTKVKISKVSLR
jgi:hypothetical protein